MISYHLKHAEAELVQPVPISPQVSRLDHYTDHTKRASSIHLSDTSKHRQHVDHGLALKTCSPAYLHTECRGGSIDDIRSRQVGDWREILYEFWVNPGGIFLLIPPNAYLYRERSTCIIHLHSQAGFLHKDNAEKSLAFWVTPVPILGWCFLQGCLLDPWRVWPFLLRSHSNQIIRLPSLHPQLSTSTHVQSYQFPYIIQIQPNHVLPIHRPLGIYIQRVSFSTLSVWAGRPFSLNDLRTDNHHHLVMLVLRQLEDLMLLNATSTTSSSTPDSQ